MSRIGAVDLQSFYRTCGTVSILAVSAIIFFYTLDWCLDTFPPKDDVLNFYNQAEMMKDGLLPYKDFVFEFPPFALGFFLIPSLFTSDLDMYAKLFGVMVTVFSLVCLYYMLRISDHMRINKVLVAAVYVILMLLYYKEMVKKFDVIPMMLTVISVYYHLKGNRALSYGLAMAGALTKIYPVLLLVLYLILDYADRHDSRRPRVIKGVAASVAVFLVAVVPLLAAGDSMEDIFSFLTFHTDRGFQVESVMGVVIQALGLMGLTTFTLENIYGTYDVISPICDALLPYWNALVAVVVIVTLLVILRHALCHGGEGTDGRDLVIYVIMLFLAFILTNKVFSTQYMLWLFPFMALLVASTGGVRVRNLAMAAYMIVMELFAAVMMMDYQQGTIMFVEENLCRDAMMIVLFIVLMLYVLGRGFIMRRYYRDADADPSSSGDVVE